MNRGRQRKRCGVLCAILLCTVLLSACAFDNAVEDLFVLPQLPMEYAGLNQQIDRMRADGYESIAPAGGANLQSMQMVALDNGGQQAAVAFFRRAQDTKPLKIVIFLPSNDSYELLCTIESSGSSIESIYYTDLTGDGRCELVVGWKIGGGLQNVAVYSVGREAVQLMSCSYSRFALRDLNQDGVTSLIVLRSDDTGEPVAEAYSWQSDIMRVTSRCSLSSTMAELSRGSVVSGMLPASVPAIFVTGVNDENMAVTDVLIWQANVGLGNMTTGDETGKSAVVQPYCQLMPQDIDGDGVTEIPCPRTDGDGVDALVDWRKYDRGGTYMDGLCTYHCQSCGWYFNIPVLWRESVTAMVGESVAGENQVTLLLDGQPLLIFYTLTGENRESRATADSRFVLRRQLGTVYAAQLLRNDTYLTQDDVRHSFYLMANTWKTSAG